jgi:DNA gyrase subunit B
VVLVGQPLFRLAQRLKGFRSAVTNLDKRADARIVAALIRSSALSLGDLRDRAKVEQAADALKQYVAANHPDLQPLEITVGWDADYDAGRIEVVPDARIRAKRSTIDYNLVESAEYHEALQAQEDLNSIGSPPYVVRIGDDETPLQNAAQLTEFLEERGRKGIQVSRYKGLGEMNAEELWETTMNPDARVLRLVKIEDALGADELFSILMGDQVEPRRAFIETHALQVRNLDI